MSKKLLNTINEVKHKKRNIIIETHFLNTKIVLPKIKKKGIKFANKLLNNINLKMFIFKIERFYTKR